MPFLGIRLQLYGNTEGDEGRAKEGDRETGQDSKLDGIAVAYQHLLNQIPDIDFGRVIMTELSHNFQNILSFASRWVILFLKDGIARHSSIALRCRKFGLMAEAVESGPTVIVNSQPWEPSRVCPSKFRVLSPGSPLSLHFFERRSYQSTTRPLGTS